MCLLFVSDERVDRTVQELKVNQVLRRPESLDFAVLGPEGRHEVPICCLDSISVSVVRKRDFVDHFPIQNHIDQAEALVHLERPLAWN